MTAHPDLEALAELRAPTLPAAMARLLRHAFEHLGLQGERLHAALGEGRLHLSGTEVALAAGPDDEVLVVAADLGRHCLSGADGPRRALRANALLMLHASIGMARGLGGPGSAQLIGRLHTTGRHAPEVAHWLASFAGLALSIRDAAPGPAQPTAGPR